MDRVRLRHALPPQEAEAKPRAAVKESPPTEDKAPTTPPTKSRVARGRCCSRGCAVAGALCTLLVLLCVGLGVRQVMQSPKDIDEQWEDVQSYVQWWWATMRHQTPPCTYAGVRHYNWGDAVDNPSTCACELRRCPPAPSPKRPRTSVGSGVPPRGEVVVSHNKASTPTVESLWTTCAAVHSPVTRDNSIDPLRVFDSPKDAVSYGIFTNVLSPMCVQAGHVYAALRPNSSRLTVTYRTGAREFFYTNLTDAVLKKGAKYHPITTVPAAGLLLSNEGQEGNVFTLIQEGLRGWSALMEEGFGLGFTSDEDKRVWRDAPRQVVFLSDPSMDIPQGTHHSSMVARQLANAFSIPTDAPFFSIAPRSRTRTGEVVREPMYCFCGGFMVPSIGARDIGGKVMETGYDYMRRTLNKHFGGAELGDADLAAVETVRTSSSLYTPEVRAFWPPRTSELPRRPRMLWVGRKSPRIVEEEKYVAMARLAGFEVLVDNAYATVADAAQQFYLARYADVVAGFHSVSLVHAMWMDSTTRPQCRTLLEFAPYANPKQVALVYGNAVTASGVRYVMVEPVDLEFIGDVFNTPKKRETAKQELMGEGSKGKFAIGHPAFTRHRAVYDPVKVKAQLEQLHKQLMECLQG
ncbi:hypothetical protein ABL78_6688 [Leptomonas seymouri]|uniref:Glycosyltransferase family 61 protein n=1 Tax=Leptomonas seymouri TaxID=5684 RepID=A0A0N1PBV1_LEPSE|nr:hypothetical protein ABL78_6688 [Leptomonas seymouri]|eukprot:KPI84254.1 hypothetical protein ABL78_6688 [Leptomonas seymouri]